MGPGPFDWGGVAAAEHDADAVHAEAADGGWAAVAAPAAHTEAADGGWAAVAAPSDSQEPTAEASSSASFAQLLTLSVAAPLTRKSRRGRPDALFLEALAEAQATMPKLGIGSAVSVPASSSTSRPEPQVHPDVLLKLLMLPKTSFIKKPRLGFCQVSTLTNPLAAASYCAQQPGAATDEGVLDIAKCYMDPEQFFLVSARARCHQLGMEEHTLQSKLGRLALAQCLQQRHDRAVLEQRVVHSIPQASLLCYIDGAAFDETPMKTTVKGDCITGVTTEGAPTALTGPSSKALQLVDTLERQVKSESMVAKLLQTKQTFCMLFKAGGSYVTLLGETVCPLQVMERTTAEVLK
jgi:hypothetical protein